MSWLIVAALTVLEHFYPARSGYQASPRQIGVSVLVLLFSMAADIFVAVAVVLILPRGDFVSPGILGVSVCFVIADAVWYVFHRFSHSDFLWPFHRWHHAPGVMNVWVYYLGHPVFQALAACVRYVPIWLLGASTSQLAAVAGLQFVWSAFGHTNLKIRIPLFEGWLLGPASHFWHHARSARVNFGICIGLWDWLGGTLYRSRTYPLRATLGTRTVGPDAWDILVQLRYPFS